MRPSPATPALMVQGAGSNVGKSLIVAGLARLFTRQGLAVRPFKPQNMSNNAAATADGGEIGRAQALQARAAGIAPSVHMNPVLLKPESERGAQVVVQGRRWATLTAREYGARKAELLPRVLESFQRVGDETDLVLVEGAGSPAEINLREGDIANMGFAEAADVPVVLVGDIDRGGVIASLVGTHAVLPDADRNRIRGFVVNRFRGDPSLFEDGMAEIARRTSWPALGLVPHFSGASALPAEDSVDLADRLGSPTDPATTVIAVPRLPGIANYDDLDPLRLEPDVTVRLIEPGSALPGDAALVLLPGSKSTISDLAVLKNEGWDIDIAAHVRRGGFVLGLCGGYQMLGRTIDDPDGVEGAAGRSDGLGLLDVSTILTSDKTTRPVTAHHAGSGHDVAGYEIHLGTTTGPATKRPFLAIGGVPDGAVSENGRVIGTYVHGLFASDAFRRWFLARLGAGCGSDIAYERIIDDTLDRFADHLETHLDGQRLLKIARRR